MYITPSPKYSRFSTLFCQGSIQPTDNDSKYDIVVSGVVNDTIKDGIVHFLASNPIDRRSSFSGSGFPYANSEQAFDATPNRGSIKCENTSFKIPLLFPNSFYTNLGNNVVPPCLFLRWTSSTGEERKVTIKLGEPVPYRFLSYPKECTMARENATFYHAHHNLPVRSQEQVFKDSIYPHVNKMHSDYWGLKPAL